MQDIKYTAPGWFARIEATIQFEVLPVQFCIQTPHTVPSLLFLLHISFDEFKMKLSTRELTLCDVEPNEFSVLHVSLTGREHWKTDNHISRSVFFSESSSGKMDMISSRTRWTLGYRGIGSTVTCKYERKGVLK